MTQNKVEDDGRKCWGSARERERRRARFNIRERIVQQDPAGVLPLGLPSPQQHILQYIAYIKEGDRSKFSLSELDRNFDVVSARIPISVLDQPAQQPNMSLRDHSLQLCTAWFGINYSKSLEDYMNILVSFTLMEYAVWMGKFSIVGGLLMAGVNPCVSGHGKGNENVAAQELVCHQMGTRVNKRFIQCFPLQLSTYIVKRAVELRWAASTMEQPAGNTNCILCQRNDMKLILFESCKHSICEVCFWQDIMDHIDDRGDYADVVVCPFCDNYCSKTSSWSLESADAIWNQTSSPLERYKLSLALFQKLPVDRAVLKQTTGKKKKLPERDHCASTWTAAVSPSLGSSQSVRYDKFWLFLERNSIHSIRGCLFAGVDVNWRNEYGQTALYVTAWRGEYEAARLLLEFGAGPILPAHDRLTPLQIAMALGHTSICELLWGRDQEDRTTTLWGFPGPVCLGPTSSILIPTEMDHPGAGSYTIDSVFSIDQVDWLLNLHNHIPVDVTQKKKAGLCSDRSYFCDSQGGVRLAIEEAILRSQIGCHAGQVQVFAHMRFLDYSTPGTILNPHVDICRVDPVSGLRSTHTFIAYLTDNDAGGATSLLASVSGEGRNDVLAHVIPKRGRLLLFPHACPHEGNEVIDVPKIILRGEVFLPGP